MALRGYFIAPADDAERGEEPDAATPEGPHRFGPAADDATPGAGPGRRGRLGPAWRLRRGAPASAAVAPSLGVLAAAHDLPVVAAAAGLSIAGRAPAALVCVHASGAELAAPVRAPARVAASRLAASLAARGLSAEARGRLVIVPAGLHDGGEEPTPIAARALAAAGALPTILAVGVRDPDIDLLLAAQDAILVALAPSAEPALAELALAGASELSRRVAGVAVAFDPVSRALALGGLRAPRGLREAVKGLSA
jgi:hypothetical protein